MAIRPVIRRTYSRRHKGGMSCLTLPRSDGVGYGRQANERLNFA